MHSKQPDKIENYKLLVEKITMNSALLIIN